MTGGDLRPGAVAEVKLAAGLSVAAARPAGPGPAASSTEVRAAGRGEAGTARLTDRQVLINQRIAQAAVRRANEMRAVITVGLTGANFADGAIAAASIDPAPRS